MKIGKVPPEILAKCVFPFVGKQRQEVLVHSGLGEDCTVIDFGPHVAVASSDPITAADIQSGHLAVFVSCNDIAACGAKPIGILVTLLLPPDADINILKGLMENIHAAASKIGIEVLGGHSEITSSVVKPIICSTAIGIAEKEKYVTSSGAKPGDDVIITKALGLEGSSILASDFEYFLKDKIPASFIHTAKNFINQISVIDEGLIAAGIGASAMHDITEGGILGAAFEVAEASGVGIEIFSEQLPIFEETEAICRAFDINPLGLISSGSMLICTPHGSKVIDALHQRGIPATIVGKIITEGKYLISQGKKTPLKPLERDELIVAIEKIKSLQSN